MIGAHPHAAWHSGERRVDAVHMKGQGTEITVDKMANKITPTNNQKQIYCLILKNYKL